MERLNESSIDTSEEELEEIEEIESQEFIWSQQTSTIQISDEETIILEKDEKISLSDEDIQNPYFEKLIIAGYLKAIS